MPRMNERGGSGRVWMVAVPGALVGLVACGDDASGKHWSELATCLAGPAASLGVAERVPKIRQVMLGNPPAASTKDGWPKRCAPLADELYTSLDGSKRYTSAN